MLSLILACLLVGAIAGLLAGMFGVGGGTVIVPGLLLVLPLVGVGPADIQHVALGTSLASIVFTGLSSARAHQARGGVHWSAVQRLLPGIALGTLAGALLAGRMSGLVLQWIFVIFVYGMSLQILLDMKPAPGASLPGYAGNGAVGAVIGCLSSWIGIGGGALTVPWLLRCNLPMKVAVGTSSAVGVPLALAGTLGYALSGWQQSGLPSGSTGYVYWPAVLAIVLASFPLTRYGAALAHRLPAAKLKKAFAVLLIIVASRMLYGLL
ncbi:sulfite exporter TauE/SafE family protein [Chitinilyticum piscinae]|uniref:Probable membrane transporter protein n=1 Tax=Chitinilyticum piscinae TaxID=2866724 RepID=A0A8J7FFT0_9NEIS|nr:sulfite exporter TauE/SafE family protein [Chitinilyticum piscinae]MBE9608230.1 sulfite exporter TauE/SafE family protein [Chitinilyticum piscinae]